MAGQPSRLLRKTTSTSCSWISKCRVWTVMSPSRSAQANCFPQSKACWAASAPFGPTIRLAIPTQLSVELNRVHPCKLCAFRLASLPFSARASAQSHTPGHLHTHDPFAEFTPEKRAFMKVTRGVVGMGRVHLDV